MTAAVRSAPPRAGMAVGVAAAVGLAAALLSACSNTYTLRDINSATKACLDKAVALVSRSRIDADLSELERDQGDSSRYRMTWATARFAAAGFEVAHTAYIDNIYAELAGAEDGLAPVIIQAHWDRVPESPGMDDNASGMVGVLECARAIVESGVASRRTIRFMLYDQEESGLRGSKYYASTLSGAQLPVFFLNFEMIGYTADSDSTNLIARQSRGDWIGVYAPDWAADCPAEFARNARLFAPGLKYFAAVVPDTYEISPLIANLARSDHLFFWRRKAPGLMLTDGAEMRNPNYHRASDSKASLDLAFMTDVVKASLASALLRAEPIAP